MTIAEIVSGINEYRKRFDLEPPGGCADEQLRDLSQRVKAKFGVELPGQYDEVLRSSNGVAVDAMSLYSAGSDERWPISAHPATEGLLDVHERMVSDGVELPGLLLLGEGEDVYFGLDLKTSTFGQFDIYGRRIRSFSSFEDMFRFMFVGRF